jgi:Tfp pilus assembly protein PilN
MKLNLLPTTVSAGNKARAAWIGSIVLAIVGIAAGVGLTVVSQQQLKDAKTREADLRPQADAVVSLANQADEVIAKASDIVRNSNLAAEIIKHNDKYTKLYDKILPRIPAFYRVTSISATPTSATTATVTIDGVMDTYQQYADLMIAMLRIEGVQTVSRSGYVNRAYVVPGLTEVDQYGRPRPNTSQEPIPDNELQRLAYYERQAATQRFEGVGGFGDPNTQLRGAGPNSSAVRVVLNMDASLQVPDIRGALSSTGGAAAGAAPAGAGAFGAAGGPAGLGGPGGGGRGPAGGGASGGAEEEER